MSYLMDQFYEGVLRRFEEGLELPEELRQILLVKVRNKLATMKGYQRIRREYP